MGIFGQGADGAYGLFDNTAGGGGGGSGGGTPAAFAAPGNFGGGGGGGWGAGGGGGGGLSYTNNLTVTPGTGYTVVVGAGGTGGYQAGARGAVRIIWGAGRAFPSTLTGNV